MGFNFLTAWQVSLAAALCAAAILWIYLWKPRKRRQLVSSTLIWEKVLDAKSKRAWRERLRLWISILMALAIALLLCLALGDPRNADDFHQAPRLAVVIDCSPSMWTRTSDGRTRRDRALAEAVEWIRRSSAEEFLVIGTSGTEEPQWTSTKAAAIRNIQLVPALARDFHLPPAILRETKMVLITDGVNIGAVPPSVIVKSVFEPAENVGITAYAFRNAPVEGGRSEVYIEVRNFSETLQKTSIDIAGTEGKLAVQAFTLEPGESWFRRLDARTLGPGASRATIRTQRDDFPLDDTAFAHMDSPKNLLVALVGRDSGAVHRVLRLIPSIHLRLIRPSDYDERIPADVFIFDAFDPPALPGKPFLLFPPPGGSPSIEPGEATSSRTGITRWDAKHPVMHSVSLKDVFIERISPIPSSNSKTIAWVRDSPVIGAQEKPVRGVLFSFNLENSDVTRRAAFPILVRNALSWISGQAPSIDAHLGGIAIPMLGGEVQSIEGAPVPSREIWNHQIFDAFEPGLFRARDEASSLIVSANLKDVAESDVNRSAMRTTPREAEKSGLPFSPRTLLLLLAALLVLGEWWAFHRGFTA